MALRSKVDFMALGALAALRAPSELSIAAIQTRSGYKGEKLALIGVYIHGYKGRPYK